MSIANRVTGYVVICHDKDGDHAQSERKLHAAAHLAYIETILDKIWVAGPLAGGGENHGSLLIFKVTTEEEARALIYADPYFGADIWACLSFSPYMAVAGDWVGGKTW
jgi:uncharacterized protein